MPDHSNITIIGAAKSLFRVLALLLFFNSQVQAQLAIVVSGNWSTVLPVGSVTEAGNDFVSTYTSATNQVLLSYYRIQGNSPFGYRIDIRKNDIDWNPTLKLSARRTGEGIPLQGNTTITGGLNFLLLTNTNQTFFSGTRGRDNVPVQFQLTGVSVLIPAKTHTTNVVFTITEL